MEYFLERECSLSLSLFMYNRGGFYDLEDEREEEVTLEKHLSR